MNRLSSCASRSQFNPDERLRQAGLKITDIRVGLLGLLHAAKVPQSAEDLFLALPAVLERRGSLKGADRVTVYRNLRSFAELGLVQATELGVGRKLFEWHEPTHHHHHVVCRDCGAVEVIENCGLDPQIESVRSRGYAQISHRLEFFGICASCQLPHKNATRVARTHQTSPHSSTRSGTGHRERRALPINAKPRT